MTAKELNDLILEWESEAGESFYDYFSHTNVSDQSWAFWLLGKGFNDHANKIIDELVKGTKCLDQELLYDVYNVNEQINEYTHWNIDNYHKNIMLMAEFLVSTPLYIERVNKFFAENPI